MNFTGFKRTVTGNIILFTNESPIENVGKIIFYQDNATGNFAKKEFRWSFNKNYWSSWTILNQEKIVSVSTGSNKYFFLEIRYIVSGNGDCSSFLLSYNTNTSQTYAPPIEGVELDHSHTVSDGCNNLGGTVKSVELIKITDAQSLCGKGCDYYLWRGNHEGTQPISSITDLQKILTNLSGAIQQVDIQDALNVDGPGIGVYFGKEDKKLYFKTLIEGNKIFITQDNHGHITLSVDDASINQLFEIVGALNGLNIGGGEGHIFKQKLDNNLEFRSLVPGNANVTIETIGDQIRIGLDPSASGENVWSQLVPVSLSIGGIKGSGDGGNYAPVNQNAIQILENMLYEYIPPRVSVNLNPSSNYYEKWVSSTEVSIYGDFDNQPFLKVRVSDVSAYDNLIGGFSHISYPDVSSGFFAFNDSGMNSNWDNVIYTIKVYHHVNSTIMSPAEVSTAMYFVNPYTWGTVEDTVNIGNITPSIIEGFINSGNKIISPKQSNEINFQKDPSLGIRIKFVYAYDASYGELNSIVDIRNNFNVSSSFDTGLINLTLGASPFPISYRVYIKNHWIDVSTFKLIFNI